MNKKGGQGRTINRKCCGVHKLPRIDNNVSTNVIQKEKNVINTADKSKVVL